MSSIAKNEILDACTPSKICSLWIMDSQEHLYHILNESNKIVP